MSIHTDALVANQGGYIEIPLESPVADSEEAPTLSQRCRNFALQTLKWAFGGTTGFEIGYGLLAYPLRKTIAQSSGFAAVSNVWFDNIVTKTVAKVSLITYAVSLGALLPTAEGVVGVSIFVPISEELYSRVLCQELLLRRLPKYIIKQLKPDHVTLVDHPAARILRVALSSTLFVAMHQPTTTRTLDLLAGGVLLGVMQDITGNPVPGMVFHAVHNCLDWYGVQRSEALF